MIIWFTFSARNTENTHHIPQMYETKTLYGFQKISKHQKLVNFVEFVN